MTPPEQEKVYTLVVRTWWEVSGEDADKSEWRGEVRNALTTEVRYFRKLSGLFRTITEMIQGPENSTVE